MAFWFLIAGGALALFATAFHGVIGGRHYMANLRAAGLPDLTLSLSLVSWHCFTLILLISALTLFYVAFVPQAAMVAYVVLIFSFAGAGLFVFLIACGHRLLIGMPGAYLLAAIGLCTWLGIR